MRELPDNSVDSVVTDPPYELGFMGKSWDNTGIANSKEMWAEALRVLKPGGHLLAFSGTRTYHRMAVAIEDAGFEVRDMIEWVYGSGFPKSLNIGKAVDKLQGNERNIVGKDRSGSERNCMAGDFTGGEYDLTKGTSEWEGWGTALKPAHESIAVAQKPFDTRSDIDYTVSICQTLFAQIVKKSSELNLSEKIQQSIAQWTAEKNINTLEDLSEVMGMLPSKSEASLSLSIVLSWLNILGEIWGAMSMFTTETKGSLTTELKILQSLEWENIFQNITQVKNNQTDGYSANVLSVENLLNAVKLKLKYILTHSAQENAISQGNKLTFAPNHEPICMARKPLAEKTVAENCLKYGTGGINIDESRVGTGDDRTQGGTGGHKTQFVGGELEQKVERATGARFPANLIHDNSEEVRECFPSVGSKSIPVRKTENSGGTGNVYTTTNDNVGNVVGYGDTGNASRFFKSIIYQAKASKSERNKGCEGLEEKAKVFNGQSDKPSEDMKDVEKRFTTLPKANNHPTVKPIALMEYLIKMVTPNGGIVLDPFAGSGSTLVAAKQNGFNYIGIEMTEEYIPIIEARLK